MQVGMCSGVCSIVQSFQRGVGVNTVIVQKSADCFTGLVKVVEPSLCCICQRHSCAINMYGYSKVSAGEVFGQAGMSFTY